jgi:hypothetical protein
VADEIDAARRRLLLARAQEVELKPRDADDRPTEVAQAPTSSDIPTVDELGTPEEVRRHEAGLRVELRTELDQRWTEEARDAAWGREVESSVQDVFSEWVSEGELEISTSCRARTCRTALLHDADAPVDGYLKALVDEHLPLEHHFFYEEGRLVIYSLNVRGSS